MIWQERRITERRKGDNEVSWLKNLDPEGAARATQESTPMNLIDTNRAAKERTDSWTGRLESEVWIEAGWKERAGQVTFFSRPVYYYGLQKSKDVIYNPCLIGQNTPICPRQGELKNETAVTRGC